MATEETPRQEIPADEIRELFDDADRQAQVDALARALDRQRREIILLWASLLLLTGAITVQALRRLRADA